MTSARAVMVINDVPFRAKTGRPGRLWRHYPAVEAPTEAVLASLALAERQRLRQLLSKPCECLWHPGFSYLRDWLDGPAAMKVQKGTLARLGTPTAVGCTTVLSATQERKVFYQFNYGRYRVLRLLREHLGRRLGKRATGELLRWDRFALESRAAIVRANTSLVRAMASRYPSSGVESSELISEGNLALLRCVDKFDCSRGFKFSTYVCRAILASFWRATQSGVRYHRHYQTGCIPPASAADRLDPQRKGAQLEELDELRQILDQNTADLSVVEQRVLDARFSLRLLGASSAAQPRTLDQIGMMLGVSREQVRQLQNQAICKIRTLLEQRFAAAS